MSSYLPVFTPQQSIKALKTSGTSSTTSIRSIPVEVKSSVTDSLAVMCAKDIHPFSFVEGEGFDQVAQKLIDIGALHGHVAASTLLPSARSDTTRQLHRKNIRIS